MRTELYEKLTNEIYDVTIDIIKTIKVRTLIANNTDVSMHTTLEEIEGVYKNVKYENEYKEFIKYNLLDKYILDCINSVDDLEENIGDYITHNTYTWHNTQSVCYHIKRFTGFIDEHENLHDKLESSITDCVVSFMRNNIDDILSCKLYYKNIIFKYTCEPKSNVVDAIDDCIKVDAKFIKCNSGKCADVEYTIITKNADELEILVTELKSIFSYCTSDIVISDDIPRGY